MDGGSIQQIGAPTDIYDRPNNTFVANFVGESNLFDATVSEVSEKFTEAVTENGLRLTVENCEARTGDKVTVLIRPEHLLLQAGNLDEYASLSGTLQQSIFVGTDFQLIVKLAAGGTLKAVIRDSARQAASGLVPGTDVTFQYLPSSAHVIPTRLGA